MAVLTSGTTPGDWLKYEAPNLYSREEIVVVSGQVLVSGSVLGKITASGKHSAYDADGATGIETAVGILLNAVDATGGDKPGVMIVRHATVNPDGLTYIGANDASDIAEGVVDLEAQGIIFREGA